jgi:thiol-disulfide isomerase/thioredoxin
MSSQVRRPVVNPKISPAAQQRRRLIAYGSVALLAIVVIATIVVVNNNGVSNSASQAPVISQIKVGDTAPNFTVSTTGGPFQLAVNGKAKPTLLEVFATWCPHCQREAPVISTLAKKYQGRVNVIGVAGSDLAMDHETPETQVDVYDWSQKYGATYPVAFDPNLDVAHKYMSNGFPTVVLIGADGKVQSLRSGEMPPSDIEKALDASLAGQTPDPKLGLKVPQA